MPRRARLVLPGVPLHVIQRGNNRQPCFFSDADYRLYLETMSRYVGETGCRVHAYVLMTNHVHVLLSFDRAEAPGALMKAVGQRYVRHVNRRHHRSGTLWEGRYRSCLVQDETYLLVCQRYIELNPVRAGMVEHPGDYRWSSYRTNARGAADPLVQPHPLYHGLGADAATRQSAYRELFRERLDADLVDEIRHAANGNFALGDARFSAAVTDALGRRATPSRAGRPSQDQMGDLMGTDHDF